MRRIMWILLACLAVAALPARAEVLSMATAGEGGTIHGMAVAIAKVGKEKQDLDIRVRTHQSPTQYLPLVAGGELTFGAANAAELNFAYNGQQHFEGRPLKDLRLVAATIPFQITIMVRADSGIESMADLKGRRVPGVYTSAPFALTLWDAMLANGGLTMDDVEMVPAVSFMDGFEYFAQDKVDVAMYMVDFPRLPELERKAGKLRALSMVDTPEAIAAMRKPLPIAHLKRIDPAPNRIGIEEPIQVMEYAYFVFTSASASEESVYQVTRLIHDNPDALTAASPVFRSFAPAEMVAEIGVPYHPGALRFYREQGMSVE